MADILDDLRAVLKIGGDTYTSEEVLGMMRRAADYIEELRLRTGPIAVREDLLRTALDEIVKEVGTSTKAAKIARTALAHGQHG